MTLKKKSPEQEAAYLAGRQDAQVLINLMYAGRAGQPPVITDLEIRDPSRIIADVCAEMKANGYSHSPRIVDIKDFDLSKFEAQESSYDGVTTEWVQQSGPGFLDDDYSGTLAVPIDAQRLFVIDYQT